VTNNILYCNMCIRSINLLQYLIYCIAISSAINIFIAIPATTNILYCIISSQQYIYCNICDHQYIVLLYYIQSTMLFCSIYRQVTKNTLNCNIRCIQYFLLIKVTSEAAICKIQSRQTIIHNFLLPGTIVGRELVLDTASQQDTTG
jgi:hypothetical protein